MELTYYKSIREDKEYQTWFYSEGKIVMNQRPTWKARNEPNYFKVQSTNHDEMEYEGEVGNFYDGWTKRTMPKNLTKEEQLEWMMISNKEDLHFIMKEREACHDWMIKHMDEILLAQKHNKKIKNSLELIK